MKVKIYNGTSWIELATTDNVVTINGNQTISGSKIFSSDTYFNQTCYHTADINIDYSSTLYFGSYSDYQRIYSTGYGGKLIFQAGYSYEGAFDSAGKWYGAAFGQDITGDSGWNHDNRKTKIDGSEIIFDIRDYCASDTYNGYYHNKFKITTNYGTINFNADSDYSVWSQFGFYGAYGNHNGKNDYMTVLINGNVAVTGYTYSVHLQNLTSTGSKFNLSFTLRSNNTLYGSIDSDKFRSLASSLYTAGHRGTSSMLAASGLIAGNTVIGVYATYSGSTYTLYIVYTNSSSHYNSTYSMTSLQGSINYIRNGQFGSHTSEY